MGLLDKMQGYFGRSVTAETSRTANNKKVVDALTIEDDMDKFIRKDALDKHETNRLVHVMFKQVRQQNNRIKTNMELFFDKWCQHHGPIVTKADVEDAKKAGTPKDKLPVENFSVAIRAAVRYGTHIAKLLQAKQDAAEWRALQGPLNEFADDGPMEDLGGNTEWANALIKNNPELKKHRSNLT